MFGPKKSGEPQKKSKKVQKKWGLRTGDFTPNDRRYGKADSGIGISMKI